MRARLLAIIVIVVLVAGVLTLVFQKHRTPEASRARMVEQFIAILPDSLGNERILEIRQLFYTLSQRQELGKVKPETGKTIDDELAGYIKKGHVTSTELVHFMAEVGYSTYKDESKYNLPDSSVDHPMLNPKAGMVSADFDSSQYDSTFWADFEKWKKENPDVIDSMTQEQYTPPKRRN